MLEIGLFVLFITALSHLIQEKSKIPASAICIIVAIGLKALGLGGIISDNAIFDGVLLLLLPILLAVDILHLRLSDLKTHALSLFYVAGISVASYPIMLTLIMKWHSSKFIEECDSDAKIAH